MYDVQPAAGLIPHSSLPPHCSREHKSARILATTKPLNRSSHFFKVVICIAALVGAQPVQQEPLLSTENIMAQPDKVFGHNNATYGPVPKEDQLFSVEFLEIAPTPIQAYTHSPPAGKPSQHCANFF